MNREHGVIVLTWILVFAGAYMGARLPGWYEARKIRAETARKWEATLKRTHEATDERTRLVWNLSEEKAKKAYDEDVKRLREKFGE